MPIAPATPPEFSYQNDVAPYASKMFDRIGADPSLSPDARSKLQGDLLGGVEDIRKQRVLIEKDRMDGRIQQLRYDETVSALEDARAKRARATQAQTELGNVQKLVSGIVSSDYTPEKRQAALAQAALDNASMLALNPDAAQIFGIAKDAISERPKGLISNAEMFSSILKGIPQEELRFASDTGDFSRLTGLAQKIDDAEYLRREKLKIVSGAGKEAEDLRMKLLTKSLTFGSEKDERDNKIDSPWLEPESTEQAELLVTHFGTPDEQKRFGALRTANSDKDRALMIADIQKRELLKRIGGAAAGSGRRSASSITGMEFTEKK